MIRSRLFPVVIVLLSILPSESFLVSTGYSALKQLPVISSRSPSVHNVFNSKMQVMAVICFKSSGISPEAHFLAVFRSGVIQELFKSIKIC